MDTPQTTQPNGAAAAALLAAGIGALTMGLTTTLAAMSAEITSFFDWSGPAGPLTGKTTVMTLVWLVGWFGLHRWWSRKNLRFTAVLVVSFALIAMGLVGTFPIFFEAFHE